MKLQNKARHMASKAILVEGTTYQIDATGVANVTDEAHAKKLLSMDGWKVAAKDEAQKAPKKPPTADPKAEPQGEPSGESQGDGADAQGEPASADAGEEPQASGEGQPGYATQEEADAAQAAANEAGKAVDPAKVPPPATDAGDGEDANAWPDPDMSMAKSYLQEMADAYEVKFEDKTTKQELVDAILKKMYD